MQPARSTTDPLPAATCNGHPSLNALMNEVYPELRAISARLLARERADHTLQPTAVVHEVFLRLAAMKRISWEDRSRFLGLTAKVMRRVLIDHARERRAEKRGGDRQRIELDTVKLVGLPDRIDILDVHTALTDLEAVDPTLAQHIELRFFAGMNEREIAATLGISRSSVQRQWRIARRWLYARLVDDTGEQ